METYPESAKFATVLSFLKVVAKFCTRLVVSFSTNQTEGMISLSKLYPTARQLEMGHILIP